MANLMGGRICVLDTDGFISSSPVTVRKAVLFPNAADDVATFRSWGPSVGGAAARTAMTGKTVTVTSTTTITSTGNFEAAEVVVGDMMEIKKTSTGNNLGYWQVKTRSSDNAIIIDIGAGLYDQGGAQTNEASKVYSWQMHPSVVVMNLSCMDANEPYGLDFGDKGFTFPNLSLDAIGTSCTVYLYLA